MRLNYRVIAIAAILSEILSKAALVLLVAGLSYAEPEQTQDIAGRTAFYAGPIAAFLFAMAAGFWAARRAGSLRLSHGLLTGAATAVLDVAIAALLVPQFQWLLLISNAGRVIAGALGGSLAEKRHGRKDDDNI